MFLKNTVPMPDFAPRTRRANPITDEVDTLNEGDTMLVTGGIANQIRSKLNALMLQYQENKDARWFVVWACDENGKVHNGKSAKNANNSALIARVDEDTFHKYTQKAA